MDGSIGIQDFRLAEAINTRNLDQGRSETYSEFFIEPENFDGISPEDPGGNFAGQLLGHQSSLDPA